MRNLLVLVALVAAAALVPGAAAQPESPGGSPAPPGALDLPVEEVWVQDTDARGRPIGPKVKLSPAEMEAHRTTPAQAAAAAAVAKRPEADNPPRSLSRRLSSGCRTVGAARVGRTLLGFVAYKFWVYKNFCWSYPNVTGVNAWVDITDVDPNYYYRGVVSAYGNFYTWCCGSSRSGHYTHRTGQFDNCILKYGCIGTYYPWVRVHGFGNGGWSYDTGG